MCCLNSSSCMPTFTSQKRTEGFTGSPLCSHVTTNFFPRGWHYERSPPPGLQCICTSAEFIQIGNVMLAATNKAVDGSERQRDAFSDEDRFVELDLLKRVACGGGPQPCAMSLRTDAIKHHRDQKTRMGDNVSGGRVLSSMLRIDQQRIRFSECAVVVHKILFPHHIVIWGVVSAPYFDLVPCVVKFPSRKEVAVKRELLLGFK